MSDDKFYRLYPYRIYDSAKPRWWNAIMRRKSPEWLRWVALKVHPFSPP